MGAKSTDKHNIDWTVQHVQVYQVVSSEVLVDSAGHHHEVQVAVQGGAQQVAVWREGGKGQKKYWQNRT